MTLKVAQAAESFFSLILDPFDYLAQLRFAEAVSRTRFVRFLHGRMIKGVPREEWEQLRALTMAPVDRPALRRLPESSFGYHYAQFLDEHDLDPSSAVKSHPPMVSLFEETWILRRFIKIHDLHHVLVGFLPDIPGEMGLLVFDLRNFNEPFGVIGALSYLFVVRKHGQPLEIAREMWRGWVLAGKLQNLFRFRYEELFERDIAEVRALVGCRGARLEGRVTGPRAAREPRGRRFDTVRSS